MLLALWDLDPDIVLCWTQRLGRYAGLTFGVGDLLRARVDAVVSPANGAGFMDGGIDLAYRNFFGLGIQVRVQKLIEARYAGAMPVGAAALVPTGHPRITRLVVAPTMDTPRPIVGTDHAYVATRAALTCARDAGSIACLGLPGMGTGIGRMDPDESASQMQRAIVEVLQPAALY
jgi:O-acetyl-ADP-ribose deacetylase (regulator of RNase III)